MRDLKARDIMSKQVHQVSPQLHLVDLENELSSYRIGGAPVVERGRLVGIVSRSDIDRALSQERSRSAASAAYDYEVDGPDLEEPAERPDPTRSALESLRTMTVRDIMTREVISVAPDDSIVEVARCMSGKRIHRVLVVEEGKPVGIVTSLDIVDAVARLR